MRRIVSHQNRTQPHRAERCESKRMDASREGTTLVELAFVLPVFLLFLFTLFEFSHAYMAINTLNAATKKAAREGSMDGISTAAVAARVNQILENAFDISSLAVDIKDAGVFDTADVDAANIDYGNLPAIELSDSEPRQLFIVRATIPYNSISLVPPFFIKNITLSGQSVMRHE